MPTINLAPTCDNRTLTLTERLDVAPGRLMLALASYVPALVDLPESGLQTYLTHASKHKSKVTVRYDDPGVGRLAMPPIVTDKKGNVEDLTMVCQPHLWNWVKAVVCSSHYTDCDISNCHPVLIVQMCEQHGLPCELLKRYIEQRSTLIAETGLKKSTFKKLFFSCVLYHPQCTEGQLARKLKKFGLDREPELFTQLRSEMCTASEHLLSLYPCYVEAAEDSKGASYFNLPGTAFSLMIQTAEKRCILALYDYWTRQSVHCGALIHDGLHVDKDAATDAHLQPASDYIYTHTGYRVQLEYKQWEAHPAYEQAVIVNDAMDCLAHVQGLLEGRIVRCDQRVWFRDSTHQWHADEKDVLRLIANAVSHMHIFGHDAAHCLHSISRNTQSQCGVGSMLTVAKQVFATAPECPSFIDDIRRENVGKLCFSDGYWDFEKAAFVPDMIDTLARVPIAFPARVQSDIDEVDRRVIDPILGELRDSMLTWFSRGVAGHVTDKAFGMWLGERNSGKSVLIGLLELALGRELVMTLNAETFMVKHNADPDTSKALGFLLQCEHARLVFTNECEVDGQKKLNGALLKKFASGGDSITARALYQNACTFKLAGRLCMAANDAPDITPADAVQTLDYFQCPRVFVRLDDERVKTDPMYMAQDDTIKAYCCEESVRAAMIHLLLDAYGQRVRTAQMDTLRSEFTNGVDDREQFYELFETTKSDYDALPVSQVAAAVRDAGISALLGATIGGPRLTDVM